MVISMVDEYPRGAYLLLLIGGILEIIAGITVVLAAGMYLMVSSYSGVITSLRTYSISPTVMPAILPGVACIVVYLIWFIVWGVLIILSAMWVKTGDPEKVHKGGILGLISSILGGNIISLIGAILALIWKKPQTTTLPPPPPM